MNLRSSVQQLELSISVGSRFALVLQDIKLAWLNGSEPTASRSVESVAKSTLGFVTKGEGTETERSYKFFRFVTLSYSLGDVIRYDR